MAVALSFLVFVLIVLIWGGFGVLNDKLKLILEKLEEIESNSKK